MGSSDAAWVEDVLEDEEAVPVGVAESKPDEDCEPSGEVLAVKLGGAVRDSVELGVEEEVDISDPGAVGVAVCNGEGEEVGERMERVMYEAWEEGLPGAGVGECCELAEAEEDVEGWGVVVRG